MTLWSYGVRFYISTQSQLMVATVMSIVAFLALGLLVFFAIRFFGEMLEESVHSHSELACRNCKSKWVHSSYPIGFIDTAFGVFDCIPYRCEVCSFRFYVRRRAPAASVTTSIR
jgi:DNA-directed RNA polymerase subunit RPC12/RpoP